MVKERATAIPEWSTVLGRFESGLIGRSDLRRAQQRFGHRIEPTGQRDVWLPSADLALHAVHHLVHQLGRTDCHFAFIGDGEMLPEMRELAGRLEVTDWVTFTGWLDQDACFAYLSTADLGIEPSLGDIVTVKCLEYLAFGVPIVAFDLGEIWAAADGAAVCVSPGDVPAFARAISQLLDDPARRAGMGRLGRRQVEEIHAWDRQEEAFLRVYEQLLALPAHGRA